MTRVENNPQKITQLMNELLCGMYFEGYKFDTSFTLRFGRNRLMSSSKLPANIELYLLGDWWFYTEKEWHNRLSMLKSLEVIDLHEPLQAFELTKLRWCGDSEISSVSLKNTILEIKFKNDQELNISCEAVEGETWILIGKNFDLSENDKWSVICEGGEYFIYTSDN